MPYRWGAFHTRIRVSTTANRPPPATSVLGQGRMDSRVRGNDGSCRSVQRPIMDVVVRRIARKHQPAISAKSRGGSGVFTERARLAAFGQEPLGLCLAGGEHHPHRARVVATEVAAHGPHRGTGLAVGIEGPRLLRRTRPSQLVDEIGHSNDVTALERRRRGLELPRGRRRRPRGSGDISRPVRWSVPGSPNPACRRDTT